MKNKGFDLDKILKIINEFRHEGKDSFYTVDVIEKYTGNPYEKGGSFNSLIGKELSNHRLDFRIEPAWDKSKQISYKYIGPVTTMLWYLK